MCRCLPSTSFIFHLVVVMVAGAVHFNYQPLINFQFHRMLKTKCRNKISGEKKTKTQKINFESVSVFPERFFMISFKTIDCFQERVSFVKLPFFVNEKSIFQFFSDTTPQSSNYVQKITVFRVFLLVLKNAGKNAVLKCLHL